MTLAELSLRNLLRSPLRTVLTVCAVAIAVLAFALLRTMSGTWALAGEVAAKDRIITRGKLSFMLPLPIRYVEAVSKVAGVEEVTWSNWFGGKDARRPELA